MGIYAAQELLESLLATGHPAGLAGIFGYGGWWAVPAAVCVGLVVAALLHGARWALHAVARIHAATTSRHSSYRAAVSPRDVLLPRLAPRRIGLVGPRPSSLILAARHHATSRRA